MDVKYRSYDKNSNLMIAILIASAVSFLLIECADKLFKKNPNIVIICSALSLLTVTVLLIMMRAKSRFIANDFHVTFQKVLSRDIVINYLDIDEITVYAQMAQLRGRYGNYHNI